MAKNERCIDFARRAATTTDTASTKPTEPISSSFYNSGGVLVSAAAANAGDATADVDVLRELRHLTTPGSRCTFETFHLPSSEPTASGGVSAQSELWATALIVVAHATPRVWDALTPSQREAATLIVRASLVSNAFATGDDNPYLRVKGQERTIDGRGNVGRDWNPNYREGMIGNILMGISFFGSAGANRELQTFSRAKLLSDARRLGLANIVTTFSWGATHRLAGVPTDSDVATALRNWAYHDVGVWRPMTLYGNLTDHTFGQRVSCGINNNAGIKVGNIVAGRLANGTQCSLLPSLGQVGMLHEFASSDTGGPRSSSIYAYMGFQANLATQVAMIAAGAWKNGPTTSPLASSLAINARKRIGITDLFTKLRLGFISYANGGVTQTPGNQSGDVVMRLSAPGSFGNGFTFTQTLWNQVVLGSAVVKADR